MTAPQGHTLPKEERLCGKTTVAALISDGKWGATAHLRYCWASGRDSGRNRLMVSVPKKFFKRAVRRNLLKRRLREAYRLQKELLAATGVDLLLAYSHQEIADFATLRAEVAEILHRITLKLSPAPAGLAGGAGVSGSAGVSGGLGMTGGAGEADPGDLSGCKSPSL